ncbi:hypothetical protein VIVU109783_22875 [Vibrio vulnificus]|uniref:hypothetical protein n=2 Tax=Vibrio vulnificus TaxID=672 RepID=UPI0005C3D614|nr:hypothetical protein [Vibrio vulnificus]PWY28150.1 hypothetical protein VV86_25050 [Vibrio vulnificus]
MRSFLYCVPAPLNAALDEYRFIDEMFSELVKYKTEEEYLYNEQPEITERVLVLRDIIQHRKVSHRVLGISGIYPVKRPRKIYEMRFVTVSTNRTYFAALKEVQGVFGLFYQETGILPSIKPMPKEFLKHPKDISPHTYRTLFTRGMCIYGA